MNSGLTPRKPVKNYRVSAIRAEPVVPRPGGQLERRFQSETRYRQADIVASLARGMYQQALIAQRRIVSDSPDPDAIRAVKIDVCGELVVLLSGRKITYENT